MGRGAAGLSPPPRCPVHPPYVPPHRHALGRLTVTSKRTALPTWLSRRMALSPRTTPPKKSRGGTATLWGHPGVRVASGGGVPDSPSPASLTP